VVFSPVVWRTSHRVVLRAFWLRPFWTPPDGHRTCERSFEPRPLSASPLTSIFRHPPNTTRNIGQSFRGLSQV